MLLMSQVTVTTTATMPPVTFVYSGASLITDSYNGFQLYGPNKTGLELCDSATIVASEGYNQGFSGPHHYATATKTTVPDTF